MPITKHRYQRVTTKSGFLLTLKVLDHLKVFRLGVSLGSTESLAEHPYSMTHSKVDDAIKEKLGITEGLIRLSIGLEATADLIDDLNRSLDTII